MRAGVSFVLGGVGAGLQFTDEFDGAGSCWKAAFAFELIGTVFLLWMGIMAWQVNRDEYD